MLNNLLPQACLPLKPYQLWQPSSAHFSTTQTLQDASRAGKANKSGMMWILFRRSKDEITGAIGLSNLLYILHPLQAQTRSLRLIQTPEQPGLVGMREPCFCSLPRVVHGSPVLGTGHQSLHQRLVDPPQLSQNDPPSAGSDIGHH